MGKVRRFDNFIEFFDGGRLFTAQVYAFEGATDVSLRFSNGQMQSGMDMPPEVARHLAALLLEKADQAEANAEVAA